MKEGSLEAPTRHPIAWTDPDFYDEAKLDAEMHRVFDICHGCRRCFNLCDSFPRLFDLIDESATGELDSVKSEDFKPVVDACTLCDMCFLTKCPYVPPHEFNLDFPHLMLRYRAVEHKKQGTPFVLKQVTETDRNGKMAAPVAGIANWATDTKNGLARGAMEKIAGIDKRADLPKFHAKTFTRAAKSDVPVVNTAAPAYGRKAALYATCFVNYNNPDTGMAARRVLAKNGVETEVVYPSCCGMPQLEQGDIAAVAEKARNVAREMKPWVEQGYDIVSLTPSCTLMLKFEWPLILPDDEDVKRLSAATKDISEYIVDIAKKEGLAEGIQALDGGVTVHIACHARAQNIGQKAAEMLRLIPETKVSVIERCSGHGGSWGIFKENYDIALKIGKPVSRQALKDANKYVVSECPLAGMHILQGMEAIDEKAAVPAKSEHPVELFAKAYGL
ncbi:MAG: glycerol-3-phosphate dehydrogenase [Alphaproteobacteria bacterium]|nr:glycerol-3-phosphate dehydrogenase [Alphaproteobacteria bacterium]MBU0796582.1 glycerol-3-phosphate dehydrogenase [Alphaproteobacteria bacterium]MBU0886349.1 glycerol-3-phosphate dehydrogenase [Alphaproteobacteria bacterium]MBU1813455.1 glycerol-3-phosphate dehydrogenase [Alphaproteobacteria bacterium]MBU2089629.1 glycerol-3-phosphate dehydrogenase [Alphaproteobacteria bacterium]